MKPTTTHLWHAISTQDPLSLGELALAKGHITPAQLETARVEQQNDPKRRLSLIFLDHGWISPAACAALLLEYERLTAAPCPERIDRFLLLAELGRGGTGVVWLAWDTTLDRAVALKRLHLDDESNHELLLKEARLAGQLSHPNIVPIHEVLTLDGAPCLVMGFVQGTRLDLVARQLPINRLVEIVRDAARAVAYAHDQSILHRDLKPENMILESSGRVMITDFGLAKVLLPNKSATASAHLVGTPAYMAPEIASGGRSSVRADVYGLGATLYTLLTGHRPFEGGTAADVLRRLTTEEPTSVRALRVHIPHDVAAIIEAAMAKDPHQRTASALDFANDLDRYLRGEPVLAKPAGLWTHAGRWFRRHKLAISIALIGLLAFVATLVPALKENSRVRQRREAQPHFDLGQAAFERAQRLLALPDSTLQQVCEQASRANVHLTEALRLDPTFAEAHLYRGLVAELTQNDAEASRDYDAAIHLHPTYRKAYLARGLHRIRLACLQVPRPLSIQQDAAGERMRLIPYRSSAQISRLQAPAQADFEKALDLAVEPQDQRFAEALLAYASHDFARAAELFELVCRADPTHVQARLLRGHSYEALNDPTRAGAEFTEAIRLEPSNYLAFFGRGWSRLIVADYTGATEDVQEVLRISPKRPEGIELAATIAIAQGHYDESLPWMQLLVDHLPDNAAYRINLAYLLHHLGRFEDALAQLAQAMGSTEAHAVIQLNRSAALYALKRYEDVLEAATQALAAGADEPTVRWHRGNALKQLKRYDEALSELGELLRLSPHDSHAVVAYGQILCELNRHDEALEYYRSKEGSVARPALLLDAAGTCVGHHQGDAETAIASFSRALALEPATPQVLVNRGLAYSNLHRYEEARRDFDAALVVNSSLAEAYFNRGRTWFLENNETRAFADLESAARANPRFLTTYQTAGLVHLQAGRPEEALSWLERGLAIDPRNVLFLEGRASALDALGRFEEALASIEALLKLSPDAIAFVNHATILRHLKRENEAIDSLRQAIKREPTCRRAHLTLAHIYLDRKEFDAASLVCTQAIELDPAGRPEYEELLRRARP